MKLTIEQTPTIVNVDGAPCRLWVGADDEGVPVHVMVRCLSPQTHDPTVNERYESEIKLLPPADVYPALYDLRFEEEADGR